MSYPMVKVVTFKCPVCGQEVMRTYHSVAAARRMVVNANQVMCPRGHVFTGKYNTSYKGK